MFNYHFYGIVSFLDASTGQHIGRECLDADIVAVISCTFKTYFGHEMINRQSMFTDRRPIAERYVCLYEIATIDGL